MTVLFDEAALTGFIREPVTPDQAAAVERVVWGWLKPVLGLSERPQEISDELFSDAIELGAIAFLNPGGLTYYQLGEERSGFSAERRTAILEDVAAGGAGVAGTGGPQGSFPPARAYPDPVEW